MLVVESVDEGEMLRVSLTEDGITAWCLVSSHHLVDEKEPQLRNAIKKTAAESLRGA